MLVRKVCVSVLSLFAVIVSAAVTDRVDSLVEASIESGGTPGAVLCISDDAGIYMNSYGYMSVFGTIEVMNNDVVFDLASLSKPVGVGLSVLRLVEEGRLSLSDTVSRYLKGFEGNITVTDLLTHTSGLPAYAQWKQVSGSDVPLMLCNADDFAARKDLLREYLCHCPRLSPPSSEFRYSCLNFITLQYVVEIVTGMRLDEYASRYVFAPLGMHHTCYMPVCSSSKVHSSKCKTVSLKRIAPTEAQPSELFPRFYRRQMKNSIHNDSLCFRGVVHDPLAREMNGGVSGNAGVFSTVNDLLLLGEWMIGKRIVKDPVMTSVQQHALFFIVPAGYESFGRTYGWDCTSDYSSCKGGFAPREAVCHTGYTGTSMVVDPVNHRLIILLTNRVHPYDGGGVIGLRKRIADVVYGQGDE